MPIQFDALSHKVYLKCIDVNIHPCGTTNAILTAALLAVILLAHLLPTELNGT